MSFDEKRETSGSPFQVTIKTLESKEETLFQILYSLKQFHY